MNRIIPARFGNANLFGRRGKNNERAFDKSLALCYILTRCQIA